MIVVQWPGPAFVDTRRPQLSTWLRCSFVDVVMAAPSSCAAPNEAGNATCRRHRVLDLGRYSSGLRLWRVVGTSSETVGWMWTARETTV